MKHKIMAAVLTGIMMVSWSSPTLAGEATEDIAAITIEADETVSEEEKEITEIVDDTEVSAPVCTSDPEVQKEDGQILENTLYQITSAVLSATSVKYTGIAQKPAVTVKAKVNGKTKILTKGTDYTLSYKNNKNAGTASVTVAGTGQYTGTITKSFKITKVALKSASLAYTTTVYTGKALKPSVKVKAKVNGTVKTLKKGTDYTVSYQNNKNVGTATVTIKGTGNYKGTLTKTFEIQEDPEAYVNKVLDDYLTANIKDGMTDLEKLDKITAFPAQYPYDWRYSSCHDMVIYGGGDCWASADAIVRLCKKIGMSAHIRYGADDGGAGSGHRNAAVLIGDDVYVAEAGYSTTETPRYYTIWKENTGYYLTEAEDEGYRINHYDGFKTKLTIPDSIDGKTITTIGALAFSSYCPIEPVKIVLPNTLTTLENQSLESVKKVTEYIIPKNVSIIGDFVFTDCDNLKQIKVNPENYSFSDDNGVLYNKEKTVLLYYPTAGEAEYKLPKTVTSIAKYAFYYTKGITKVVLPASVEEVGEGAFAASNLQKIYFKGDKPDFEDYVFYDLDNTVVFYPKGNKTWDGISKKYPEVTWKTWEPGE